MNPMTDFTTTRDFSLRLTAVVVLVLFSLGLFLQNASVALATDHPGPLTAVLSPSSDSGVSNTDGITTDITPTITGTVEEAEAGGGGGSIGLTPTADTTLAGAQISLSPLNISDGDPDTYGRVRYRSPQAIIYDLGSSQPVMSATYKMADMNDASTGILIYVEGRNATSGAWTRLYTGPFGQASKTLYNVALPGTSWQYVRFYIAYIASGSKDYMNWYEANVVTGGGVATPNDVGIYEGETLLATTTPDGTDWSVTLPSLSQGVHNLTAHTLDESGNPSADSIAIPITVDTTAPTSSVTGLAATSDSLELQVPYTATDAGGLNLVRMYYTDNNSTPTSGYTQLGNGHTSSPVPFTAAGEGDYSFYTVASDLAGNVEAIPASADATVSINLTASPPDNGELSPNVDGNTAWTTNTSIIAAADAPSGDGFVTRLSAPEGEQATAYSASRSVVGGQIISVNGSWRVSGRGATLALCFNVGGCFDTALLGNINGSTINEIGWTDFDIAALTPAEADWAYLTWSVGSHSDIDDIYWSLDGASTGNTQVYLQVTISVTAPAIIAMGTGIPGDELTANGNVQVITNNNTGYALDVAVTDMSAGGADAIAASALSARNTVGGSFTNFAGPGISLPLAQGADRTTEAGETINLDLRVLLPFVASGTYNGTATFTATTQ